MATHLLVGNPTAQSGKNQERRGGIEHSKPVRFSTLELTLRAPRGGAELAAQIDGEEWTASPRVRIDVEARALRLVVPRDA